MRMTSGRLVILAVAGVCCGVLAGCRSAAEKPVEFANSEMMHQLPENEFFRREWVKRNFNWSLYRKICVAPPTLNWRIPNRSVEDFEVTGLGMNDVRDFRVYMYNSLRIAAALNGFEVVNKPTSDSLNIELALVKAVPGKPIYKIITVPLLWLGIPLNLGLNYLTENAFRPSLAIECRVTAGPGMQPVMYATCNEEGKKAIINLLDFTRFGHQRQLMDEMAQTIILQLTYPTVRSFNAPKTFVVLNY